MRRTRERLKFWRIREALTQGECATRAGTTQSAWSDIESGKRKPSLAQAAGIDRLTRGEVRMTDWLPKASRPPDSPKLPIPDDAA